MSSLTRVVHTQSNRNINEDAQIDKVSKDMESLFVKYLMDELRKSDGGEDLFGVKKNDFFESSLYDEYAKLISERGDFGLSKVIKADILKNQKGGR